MPNSLNGGQFFTPFTSLHDFILYSQTLPSRISVSLPIGLVFWSFARGGYSRRKKEGSKNLLRLPFEKVGRRERLGGGGAQPPSFILS